MATYYTIKVSFYKLVSGCISHRIKSTLDTLIANSQTGFIQVRFLVENTRFIYDLMEYTETNKIPGLSLTGLLMFIDFYWKELLTPSLGLLYIKFYNFLDLEITLLTGWNFWIIILKASTLQSGFLSDQFNVQRGCRKGDPVAPYLFILCAEILALLAKQRHKRHRSQW